MHTINKTICVDSSVARMNVGNIFPILQRMPALRHVSLWLANKIEKRRSRLVLAELTFDQLKDIGVTPAEARREASVSFWR